MKWIIIAIGALIVIGGGAFVLLNGDDEGTVNNVETSSDSDAVNAQDASLNDLFARGDNIKCTYDVNDGNGQNSGVAYFSGEKKMYGEFTNEFDGKKTEARVIRNGDTQYVWQKAEQTGFKTDVSASNKQSQEEKSNEYDPDEKYEFSCSSWNVDSSKFNPPSSVKFQDLSAKIQQSQQNIENIRNQACEKITEPQAKAACEAAL